MLSLHIEPYLNGELPLLEQRNFEQALLTDLAVQEQLKAALLARKVVAEVAQQELIQQFAHWEAEAQLQEAEPIRRRRLLSMVAGLGLFLFLSMGARLEWVGHRFEQHPWKEVMRPVQTEIPAWEAIADPALQVRWEDALRQYEQQRYEAASTQLIELIARLPDGEVTNRCRLYLGSCQLMLQEGEQAISVLLGMELGSRYALEARYLMGLAYWKNQQLAEADQHLTTLSQDIHAGHWQASAREALQLLVRSEGRQAQVNHGL
ncbi:MAG: hypothetical protein AAF399_04355 [Bacteroidota bacterium]